MKEAMYYKKLKNKQVQCNLCPHNCTIKENSRGFCGVRKNIEGKLYSLVYNRPCAIQVDPIEKKPLYHFLPGSKTLSIGTVGCNLFCLNCQNYHISRANPEKFQVNEVDAEKIVKLAEENNCKSIAYTYTEFTVFYEYMLEIAKLAKKHGIKNVIVSNGYVNEEPLKELCKYIDGANIDLKAFSNEFYKKYCNGRLAPILKSLKILKRECVYFEITNLLIPGLNDKSSEIERLVKWVSENLNNIVIHFSRFFPMYKMLDKEATPISSLKRAKKIAEKYLDYVYLGNVDEESNTYCKKCNKLLIERKGYSIIKNNVKNGKCDGCDEKLVGVWE